MKRKIIIIILFIAVILFGIGALAVGVFPVYYWNKLPSIPLNVWIVDKTVPVPDYREHKGIMWVLNHNKIVWDKTNRPFEYDKDFYGFFPIDKDTYDIKKIPNKVENPDLIYITDTYGVYNDDYLKRNVKGSRSQIIYGGLQSDEINILKSNLKNKNTLIGEFNIASSPTNSANRKELENIFGIKWNGWKGRYFRDLKKDLEVPVWMVQNYEKQYGGKWKFNGEGIVLVSDTDEIVVLEYGKDIGNGNLTFKYSKDAQREFGIKETIPYYYWFEFTKPSVDVEVLATYDMDVTKEGRKKLDKIGLDSVFPSIMRYKNSQYDSYYFAGDYADMQRIGNTWAYYGLDWIRRVITVDSKGDSDFFFWKAYAPMMKKIIGHIEDRKSGKMDASSSEKVDQLPAKVDGKRIQVKVNGKWKDFTVKGVNIGSAMPGKWFTEFPDDTHVYDDWLRKIGDMNANTIRVYTLQPPSFYRAFLHYNKTNPSKKIMLLQEIWPEESPAGNDYLKPDYEKAYKDEIMKGIDAIHGNVNIPERRGRAFGLYTADVSNYVLGYLVGRELEPEEVIETDKKNKGFRFSGGFLKSGKNASPTESWLAENCDYVLEYETWKYGCQHPVSIVSWPTLDSLSHDSEWNEKTKKTKEFNDLASIDINHIELGSKMKAGFFGSYHIYPNYPDFMNNEISYKKYKDSQGRFMYGGYLKEFMKTQKKYPALIAEFGLATGMGTAHKNPDGLNHGGVTEKEQGDGIVKMMKAIEKEKYAGGLIFEWIDEWAKKTWTTEPYMIPYERHVFWHNITDPEQNYGILSYESKKPDKPEIENTSANSIKNIQMSKNTDYLYLDVLVDDYKLLKSSDLLIGIDTVDRKKGGFRFTSKSKVKLPSGVEFMFELKKSKAARLLVQKGYNFSNGDFMPKGDETGKYDLVKTLINKERSRKDGSKIKAEYEDRSILVEGSFVDNSKNNWYIDKNILHIRIPWARLGFSDPSSMKVLFDEKRIDNPTKDQIKIVTSDGILVYGALKKGDDIMENSMNMSKVPFMWKTWINPEYTQRLKGSYDIIKSYFGKIN